ncbi:hypothetical protein AC579_8071 [Pseudocercospora musae]|uniref:Uncharacterized protein n=1 Tax=Pseudocercospora musae TaxID=113226 RepID=A0A139IG59_9PEZI|nr:hypothetical protein AC579_8071 [Pseudocercospora musae]
MLYLRLKQAQAELQSHRAWLTSFRSIRALPRWQHEQPDFARSSSTGSRSNAELKIRRQVGRKQNDEATERNISSAQRRKQERWAGRRQTTKDVQLEVLSIRTDLLQAVEEQRTKDVIRLYNELPEKRPLAERDFAAIAQWTHQALRLENQARARQENTKREDTEEIVAFVDQLVKDVRQGNIVPSVKANQHILGIYKESGTLDAGKKFWSWLEGQDDSHVQVQTYAVAIELLAISGAALDEIEPLYGRALIRFPGSFHAYHLSPEAILYDRERPPPVRGLPLGLLQSITTARLMRGDSRKAYLGLDTALRLYPTSLDVRFLRLFMTERPLSEAYTIFAMACQAGYKLPTQTYRSLLDNLRAKIDPNSFDSQIATLRTILAATYLQLGCSGTVFSNTTAVLIITMTELFRLPGIGDVEPKKRKKLVDSVLALTRKIFEVFARYGVLPPQSVFNAIIMNIAGHGHSKEVLGIALKDLEALGMEASDVTRRSILSVAGIYKDEEFVKTSWDDIVVARRDQNEWPAQKDFFVLAKACKQIGSDFAQKQFDALKTFVPDEWHSAIQYSIDKQKAESSSSLGADKEVVSFDQLSAGIKSLDDDLDVIDKITSDRPTVLDFSEHSVPLQLLDTSKLMQSPLNIPEEDMRSIYDSLTTEQAVVSPSGEFEAPEQHSQDSFTVNFTIKQVQATTDHLPPQQGPSLSSSSPPEQIRSATNVTLGELRYRNWKCINYLLQLAEKHDQEYDVLVDKAIAAGTRPPARVMGFTKEEAEIIVETGLSEPLRVGKSKTKVKVDGRAPGRELSKQLAQQEIIRLRGLPTPPNSGS